MSHCNAHNISKYLKNDVPGQWYHKMLHYDILEICIPQQFVSIYGIMPILYIQKSKYFDCGFEFDVPGSCDQ